MRKPPTFNSLQQALIQIGNRCNQKSLRKRPISTTLTYLTRSGSGLGARRFKSSRPINRFKRYSPVDFMGERVVAFVGKKMFLRDIWKGFKVHVFEACTRHSVSGIRDHQRVA